MMLHNYRCSTCGKIWYEEESRNPSVEHSCPDGCDDAGEYLGYIEVLISNVNNLKIGEGGGEKVEDAGIEAIADAIYRGYGSETHFLFGIEPKHEKAVRSIIKLAITKYKEVYVKKE